MSTNANNTTKPASTPSSSSRKSMLKHGFEQNDVICGVGNFTNHGNVVLNELVEECLPVFYQKETSREDKQMLMENIYDGIETLGGRFMDYKTKKPLTRKEALTKIKTKMTNTRSKMLRQKAKAKLKAAATFVALAQSGNNNNNNNADNKPAAASKKTKKTEPPKTESKPPAKAAAEPTKKPDPDPSPAPAAPSASPAPQQAPPSPSPSPAPAPAKNKNRIKVERNRLLVGPMDEAHALNLLPKLDFKTNEAKRAAQLLLAQLSREKDQLLAWANQELRQAMVTEAVKVGLITSNNGNVETCFPEIIKAAEKPENLPKIRSITHSLFYPHNNDDDSIPSPWITAKQVEYLERQNLIYKQSDDDGPISSEDYGYVYTLIAKELENLGETIAPQSSKKRASNAEQEQEEEQPSPKKAKVEASSDSDDESVPIAVLKQQKQKQQGEEKKPTEIDAAAPKEDTEDTTEDTSNSTAEVEPAPVPVPVPAPAPTPAAAVVVETVQEDQDSTVEEEMPVPTSQTMGAQVHASVTQPEAAEKIDNVTASVPTSSTVDKTTGSGNEDRMDQQAQQVQMPSQDYVPQEEGVVQEVYDEKPLDMMDPSTWTAEQKALVAIGGICFLLLVLQMVV